eukprot:gene5547-6728_t
MKNNAKPPLVSVDLPPEPILDLTPVQTPKSGVLQLEVRSSMSKDPTFLRLCRVQAIQAGLFNGLTTVELERLVEYVTTKVWEKGRAIIRANTYTPWFGVISKGVVGLNKDYHTQIKTLRAGDLLGEVTAMTGGLANLSVNALTNVQVLTIQDTALTEINLRYPDLGLKLIQICARSSSVSLQRTLVSTYGEEAFLEYRSEIVQEKLWPLMKVLQEKTLCFGEDFTAKELKTLSSYMYLMMVRPGARVINRGQLAQYVLLVLSGTLEAHTDAGRVLGKRKAGMMVGEEAFIQSFSADQISYTRNCDVYTGKASECALASLSHQAVVDMNYHHPTLAWKVCRHITRLAFEVLLKASKDSKAKYDLDEACWSVENSPRDVPNKPNSPDVGSPSKLTARLQTAGAIDLLCRQTSANKMSREDLLQILQEGTEDTLQEAAEHGAAEDGGALAEAAEPASASSGDAPHDKRKKGGKAREKEQEAKASAEPPLLGEESAGARLSKKALKAKRKRRSVSARTENQEPQPSSDMVPITDEDFAEVGTAGAAPPDEGWSPMLNSYKEQGRVRANAHEVSSGEDAVLSPGAAHDLLDHAAVYSQHFRSMESGEMRVLARSMLLLHASKGDYILKKGESATFFAVMLDGVAVRCDSGDEKTYETGQRGPAFLWDEEGVENLRWQFRMHARHWQYREETSTMVVGEMEMFTGKNGLFGRRLSNVVASTNCIVGLFQYEDVISLNESSPEIGLKLIRLLGFVGISALKHEVGGLSEMARFQLGTAPKIEHLDSDGNPVTPRKVAYHDDVFDAEPAIEVMPAALPPDFTGEEVKMMMREAGGVLLGRMMKKDELKSLISIMPIERVPLGEAVMRKGQKSMCAFMLMNGQINQHVDDLNSPIIGTYRKGTVLGESALLQPPKGELSVMYRENSMYVASSSAVVGVLTIEHLQELNFSHPKLVREMFVNTMKTYLRDILARVDDRVQQFSSMPQQPVDLQGRDVADNYAMLKRLRHAQRGETTQLALPAVAQHAKGNSNSGHGFKNGKTPEKARDAAKKKPSNLWKAARKGSTLFRATSNSKERLVDPGIVSTRANSAPTKHRPAPTIKEVPSPVIESPDRTLPSIELTNYLASSRPSSADTPQQASRPSSAHSIGRLQLVDHLDKQPEAAPAAVPRFSGAEPIRWAHESDAEERPSSAHQMAELELAEDQRSQYDLQWHPQERMPPGHMLHGYGRRAINAPGSYEERMVLQEQLMEGKRHTGRAALQAPGDIGQTSSGGQPALLAIGKRPNLPRQMYTEHIAMQYGGDQSGGIEEPAAEPAARVNRKLPSAPSREELKQHVVKMQL